MACANWLTREPPLLSDLGDTIWDFVMAAGCGREMLFQNCGAVSNGGDKPFGHSSSPNLWNEVVDDFLPDWLCYVLGNAAIDEDFDVTLGQ